MSTALMSIRWVKINIHAAVNVYAASLFPKMVRLTYILKINCTPNESEDVDYGVFKDG